MPRQETRPAFFSTHRFRVGGAPHSLLYGGGRCITAHARVAGACGVLGVLSMEHILGNELGGMLKTLHESHDVVFHSGHRCEDLTESRHFFHAEQWDRLEIDDDPGIHDDCAVIYSHNQSATAFRCSAKCGHALPLLVHDKQRISGSSHI
jgi:hypothetical protein